MYSRAEKIAIIGAGVVGTALGFLLSRKGYRVLGFSSRKLRSAKRSAKWVGRDCRAFFEPRELVAAADTILITTPDRAIREVCDSLARAGAFRPGQLVLHTSGFFSSRILRSARRRGAYVGSIHPLQSFVTPQVAVRLIPRSVFGWEGTAGAQGRILRLVRSLGGIPLEISPESKPLYHAAAVFVSNYTSTLFAAGVELMDRSRSRSNRKEVDSAQALLPLLLGTSSNLEKIGLPKALTGPIARGDLAVVQGHLRTLRQRAKTTLPLYLLLGRRTIPIALKKGGLKASAARTLRRRLR